MRKGLQTKSILVDVITSSTDSVRNQAIESLVSSMTNDTLSFEIDSLLSFRDLSSTGRYENIRATIFLSWIFENDIFPRIYALRQHICDSSTLTVIPHFSGIQLLNQGSYYDSAKYFLSLCELSSDSTLLTSYQSAFLKKFGNITPFLSSLIAKAFLQLAMCELSDLVRYSVKAQPYNQWMFHYTRTHFSDDIIEAKHNSTLSDPLSAHSGERTHTLHYPPHLSEYLLQSGHYLQEQTPVRIDITHSIASDVFFLAMDYP